MAASPKWGCKNDCIPTCRVKEGDCEGRVVGTAMCGVRVGGADEKKTWEEVVMVSVRMPQLVVVVVMVVVVRQWVFGRWKRLGYCW